MAFSNDDSVRIEMYEKALDEALHKFDNITHESYVALLELRKEVKDLVESATKWEWT